MKRSFFCACSPLCAWVCAHLVARLRGRPALRLVALLLGGLLSLASAPVRGQVVAGPDSVVVPGAGIPPAASAATPVRGADSVARAPKEGLTRPAKAALWGLIPGGGQVYNRRYWKLPIVYAAIGGAAFAMWWNQDRYIRFGRAYRRRLSDTAYVDTDALTSKYQTASLPRGKSFYRRNRDFNFVLLTAAYGLSIMEALVDAHMATFTVSDDLSLRLTPAVLPTAGLPVPGLGLTLTVR